MKKLILLLTLILLTVGLSAQNKKRYVFDAYGGISVGGNYDTEVHDVTIGDIKEIGGKLWFIEKTTNDTLEIGITQAGSDNIFDLVPRLADTAFAYTQGAGAGFDADSALFAKGQHGFGIIPWKVDTMYVAYIDNTRMSDGDSLIANWYVGNAMTLTATDSLFTAPQGIGHHQTTLTPNKRRKVYPGEDLWIQLKANQPTGFRPKEWQCAPYYYIIPD